MEIIKGQLYRTEKADLIVIAEENSKNNTFSGTVIGGKSYDIGHYSKCWAASQFQLYSAEIIIKEVIDFSKVQFIEMASGEVVITDGEERDDKFDALNLKTARFEAFKKSEAKRVVTAKFE
jgi:hypothetical protein